MSMQNMLGRKSGISRPMKKRTEASYVAQRMRLRANKMMKRKLTKNEMTLALDILTLVNERAVLIELTTAAARYIDAEKIFIDRLVTARDDLERGGFHLPSLIRIGYNR
jgi:hypothetical protein